MGSPSFTLLFLVLIITIVVTLSDSSSSFSPVDNYLIDCGSLQQTKLSDGRTFKSDRDTASLLSSSTEPITISGNNLPKPSPAIPSSSLPLYTTLRLFSGESSYSFHISRPGKHFVRLYFYPIPHPAHNLSAAVFRVSAGGFVLLEDFSVSDTSSLVFKEFLVPAVDRISLTFTPKKPFSMAFVNAIEVVSAPDSLISSDRRAYETVHRVNVGGSTLGPGKDSLYRTWESDVSYNAFVEGSKAVSVPESLIKFPTTEEEVEEGSVFAPAAVYATAQRMRDPETLTASFNLTWKLGGVDPGFSYLVRFHFCDIIGDDFSVDRLFFGVYVDGVEAVPGGLDLSSLAGALAVAYRHDFVLENASYVAGSTMVVQVGCSGALPGKRDALLNGLEIFKRSDYEGRLSGVGGVTRAELGRTTVAAVGLGLAVLVLLGAACFWRRRRPQDLRRIPGKTWDNSNSKLRRVSSWLLPLQGSYSYSRGSMMSMFGSKRSNSSSSSSFMSSASASGGRAFTLAELKAATRGFEEAAVIGVGGFGKVYAGVLDDGTKVAVKRGSPGSEQGITEFRTEIETLSRLRHRHLVSLVGFCDERSEMILVYEYMAGGPLRDRLHVAAAGAPSLTWRQRLEACAGAARGLHYLHTGAARGTIIHRDVKSTNILLDDDLVAKVSDFGLSKAAPTWDGAGGHVSTVVKGSFGYLDPEYFRRQQLTEKSDVYSFGVVLLEALCGRAAVEPKLARDRVSLAEWAMRKHREGKLEAIVDARIADSIGEESLKKFMEAAEKCLSEDGVDRPTMGDVLWNLEYCIQLQDAASVITNANKKQQKLEKEEETPLVVVDVCDDSSVSLPGIALFSQGR